METVSFILQILNTLLLFSILTAIVLYKRTCVQSTINTFPPVCGEVPIPLYANTSPDMQYVSITTVADRCNCGHLLSELVVESRVEDGKTMLHRHCHNCMHDSWVDA